MNEMQRAAVLAELAEQLSQQGSWCGETHLQKTAYFLQTLLGVPLGVEFVFYKHGPYSFDLTAALTAMRAWGLLEYKIKLETYGPSLVVTERSVEFRKNYLVTLGKYTPAVAFVTQALGRKNVSELERLATALFVSEELGRDASVDARAERVHELKPHVPLDKARQAVQEADEISKHVPQPAMG